MTVLETFDGEVSVVDVRTPPLSPSATSAVAVDARGGSGGGAHTAGASADVQFWCHECNAHVATMVDAATDEMCCQQCGGNFVEEIESDDPPESFQEQAAEPNEASAQSTAAPSTSSAATTNASNASSAAERDHNDDHEFFSRYISEIQNQFGDATPGRDRGEFSRPAAGGSLSNSLLQLLSGNPGGGARTARIISSDGMPMEVFIGDSGGDIGGLFGALGGMFNGPMTGLASNPGDYAFGSLSNVINQLMQNDPNRHGAPPAAKDVVETLPKLKITQSDVDASAECPVCKDLFVVDEESHKLPCAHSFHIDCILPWLKQHNSCPVCRHELPTDDPDYERRRRQSMSD